MKQINSFYSYKCHSNPNFPSHNPNRFKRVLNALISICILPTYIDEEKKRAAQEAIGNQFLKNTKFAQRIRIKTFDKAALDGAVLFSNKSQQKSFESSHAKDQKWVIVANAQLQYFESSLEDSKKIGETLSTNVLTFNYRGVGRSRGRLRKIDDLVTDTDACIKYLLSMGVKEDKIILYGQSLGGAVIVKAGSLNPKINIITFNTFSSIAAVVRAHARIPVIRSIAVKIVQATSYDLNPAKSWKKIKGKKFIILHSKDEVIKSASLYKRIKKKGNFVHIKIKTKLLVLPLGKRKIEVKYNSSKEFKEKAKVGIADANRFYIETCITYYGYNKMAASIAGFPSLSNYKKSFKDIVTFIQTLQNDIELIDQFIEKNKSSIQKVHDLRDLLNGQLLEVTKISKFKLPNPKMSPHNYPLLEDTENWKKVMDFAETV